MASAGRILLIPRGRYDSKATYQMLDVVLHNGVSWVCKCEVTGVEPSDQAIEWQRLNEDIYKDVIGNADISGIGDGTVKGAIRDIHYTKLLSNVSLFSVNENGLYYVESPTDAPSGGGYSGYLRVTNYPSDISNYKVIEFTPYNFTGTYVNVCTGGTWKGWKEVAFADEYLPLTGGTLSGDLRLGNSMIVCTDIMNAFFMCGDRNRYNAFLLEGVDEYPVQTAFRVARYDGGVYNSYPIFGEHNKPSGSYTGNGSATARTIATGGIGNVVIISCGNNTFAILTAYGGIGRASNNTLVPINADQAKYINGIISLSSNMNELNSNGQSYSYQVL